MRALCALIAAACSATATRTHTGQPHLLLIISDQFRAEALTIAGNRAVRTPSLDWLAATGARFTRHYSSTPTCTPARAAILTGRSPWGHGMLGYGEVARSYANHSLELGGALHAAGYYTASIGKNHFECGKNDTRYAHGFDRTLVYDGLGTGFPDTPSPGDYDDYDAWFAAATGGADPLATGEPQLDWNSWRGAPYIYDEALHPTAWTGSAGVAFVKEMAARGADAPPFFLKLSFHRPHSPYDPPARLLNATLAEQLPLVHAGGNWDTMFKGPNAWCGPQNVDAWCGEMPVTDAEVSRRAYYAGISFVDEWIGAVVRALNETDALNNTMIVFTSDHGDGLGDHYHWRKGYPYESTANGESTLVMSTRDLTRIATPNKRDTIPLSVIPLSRSAPHSSVA